MDYKIRYLPEVYETLNSIDDYYILNYGNYNLINKIINKLDEVSFLLSKNPYLGTKYTRHLYKFPIPGRHYIIYYSIDLKSKTIVIEKLLSEKQNQ